MGTTNVSGGEASPVKLLSRYDGEITAHLRCFDRVIIHGTLVDVAHPGALLTHMNAAGFRPRDLARFAEPINRQVRDHAIKLARQHGVEIEQVTTKKFRQEDRVAAILKKRGYHPGLIHVFAVKERANVFDTRNARADGYAKVFIRPGACMHYYFYWMHEDLGLIHVRVPTWLPLRLQVYLNGHSWLSRQLDQAGITYELTDNALSACSDWARAQALADAMDPRVIHKQLKELTELCCPASAQFPNGYHWCLTQVEYSHDFLFKSAERVDRLFDELARQSLLVIKAEDVARFLGKRLPMGHDTRVDSHLGRRHAGLRLKHSFGPASVKLYNKPGGILRLEVTTYDVSFFKHYREVVHRDGTKEQCVATMKKSIYSLRDLAAVMRAGAERYADWLAALLDHSAGRSELDKLSRPERDDVGRSFRGFNPFLNQDAELLQTILRGEHAVGGITARRIRKLLCDYTPGKVGRVLKRLRLHGLLRKIGKSYTYYVTSFGQRVLAAALHLKEQIFLPKLCSCQVNAA